MKRPEREQTGMGQLGRERTIEEWAFSTYYSSYCRYSESSFDVLSCWVNETCHRCLNMETFLKEACNNGTLLAANIFDNMLMSPF